MEISEPVQHNSWKQKAKFASGSLTVHTTLDCWAHEWFPWEKQRYVLNADWEHMQPSGGTKCSSAGYCCLAGAVSEPFKGHSNFPLRHLLQDSGQRGNMMKLINVSIDEPPWSETMVCRINIIQSSKAFYKATGAHFSRILHTLEFAKD